MTAAAVVAGNAVVMKPSDQTPVIGARLMELLIEAGSAGRRREPVDRAGQRGRRAPGRASAG